MLKNYFTVALRHFRRTKLFSLINILGLSIAMGAAMIIFLHLHHELSFDEFHSDASRIYRLSTHWEWSEGSQRGVIEFSAAGFEIAEQTAADFGEVDAFVKIQVPRQVLEAGLYPETEIHLRVPQGSDWQVYKESRFIFTDPNFFQFFDFELLRGKKEEVLRNAHSLVISARAAKKYFGESDPVGKEVQINNEAFLITGIFDDLPSNSSLQFDLVASNVQYESRLNSPRSFAESFIKLNPGTDADRFSEKLNGHVDTYFAEPFQLFASVDPSARLILQPLTEVHFKRFGEYEDLETVTFSTFKLRVLLLAGLLILTVAWVNYTNLISAGALVRKKEVGIRKVVGASRVQLISQFVGESLLMNFAATALAITLSQLLQPLIVSQGIYYDPALIFSPAFAVPALGIVVTGSVLSAFYPAFVMSKPSAVGLFKGKNGLADKSIFIRKILLGLQFSFSISLIIVMGIIYRQIDLVLSQDLGFNKEQVLIVKAPSVQDDEFASRKNFFGERLTSRPSVTDYTSSYSVPGEPKTVQYCGHIVARKGVSSKTLIALDGNGGVDHNFGAFYGLKLLAGRDFRENARSDYFSVLISKRASERLGFSSPEEAIGASLVYQNERGESELESKTEATVIGVFEDYHALGLYKLQEQKGMLLTYGDSLNQLSTRTFSVKLAAMEPDQLEATIAEIRNIYSEVFPEEPFDYYFLDQYFNSQYAADLNFRNIVAGFGMLAVIISSLGLFGLVSILAIQKTKEIGIRKVLGASFGHLFLVIGKNYLLIICIASFICIPIAYLAVDDFLNSFAVRLSMKVSLFLVPILSLLLLTFLVILSRVIYVTRINPSQSLRYE